MGRCRIATTAPPSRPPLAVSGSCGTLPSLAESRRATLGPISPRDWARRAWAGQVWLRRAGSHRVGWSHVGPARLVPRRVEPHRRCAAPPLCRTAAVSHRRCVAPPSCRTASGRVGPDRVGPGRVGRVGQIEPRRVRTELLRGSSAREPACTGSGRVGRGGLVGQGSVGRGLVGLGQWVGSLRVLGGWLGAWRGLVGSSSFQPSGGNSVSVHSPAMITRSCPGWSPHAGEAGHARRRSCPPRRRPCQAGSAGRGRSAGRRRPGTGDSPARRPARSRSPAPV
jgi:hypothetical protein